MDYRQRDRTVRQQILAAARSAVYATGFVLLWWWVVVSVRPLDAGLPALPRWVRTPGLVVAALGGVLAVACVGAFVVAGRGTPAPFDAPRRVVAAGPYRWVRNPMYLGAMLVIAGCGCALRSPAALGVAVLFIVVAHLFVLLYEEPTLERRFGAGYLDYKRSVNRWLPRRPTRRP